MLLDYVTRLQSILEFMSMIQAHGTTVHFNREYRGIGIQP